MKRKYLILCITLFATFVAATAQNDRAIIRVKSVFIYNFTLYIDWPESYKTGDFVVGIFADSKNMAETNAMYSELQNMAKTKKAGSQPFKIKLFKNVSEITKTHILYVPRGASPQIENIIKQINSNDFKTLIVTDMEGLAKKGSAINFVLINQRQKFELNEKNATKYELKVAAKFKNLAILVE